MLTTIGAYYGSLLVYAIMGGIFLVISPACSTGRPFFLTLLFFAAGGLMVALFKVSRIAEINFI